MLPPPPILAKDPSWSPQSRQPIQDSAPYTSKSITPESATAAPYGYPFKPLSQTTSHESEDRRSTASSLGSVPSLLRDDTSRSTRSAYLDRTPSEQWSQPPYFPIIDAPKGSLNRILPIPTATILPPVDNPLSRYTSLPERPMTDRPPPIQSHEHELHRLQLNSPNHFQQTNSSQPFYLSSSNNASSEQSPTFASSDRQQQQQRRNEKNDRNSLATLLQASEQIDRGEHDAGRC